MTHNHDCVEEITGEAHDILDKIESLWRQKGYPCEQMKDTIIACNLKAINLADIVDLLNGLYKAYETMELVPEP